MPLRSKLNPPFATGEKKGLTIKPFRFLKANSATTMPRVYHDYKPPKLKKTKGRWYIEYWYRVPEELKGEYNREWIRKRVFEDINRYKTEEYAQELLKNVKEGLANGYNPFEEEREYFLKPEKEPEWSLNKGLDNFILYCKDKGLRQNSVRSYQTLVNFLKVYFLKDNKIYQPVSSYTKEDIKGFFAFMRRENKWSNYTSNNYKTYINAVFNWFVKEEVIAKSPVNIETLPVNITSHKYFSDEIADKLKEAIKTGNPKLYEFIQFIYFTATRPKSEARLLQVKHILFDRKLLFVPAQISKNKTDDHIPLGNQILALLKTRKGQPAEYYIFGGAKKHSTNVMTNWFKDYKDKFGLKEESLYAWKHTRCIDLAKAGADPYQIMQLFRHKSLEETIKYMRGLGLTDFKEIHEKTKKF